MEFGVGSIVEGKVTGITKFGAFVSLPGGRSGLVHISEIAYTYVNDVKDHLTEGQEVKVKVIGIDDNNRINLSIKKAMDPPPRPQRTGGPRQGGARRGAGLHDADGRPGKEIRYVPRARSGDGRQAACLWPDAGGKDGARRRWC